MLVAIVAVGTLGACSESNGTSTPGQAGQTVPEATLPPPSNTLPPGVTQLCSSVVASVVRKIVGPLHGSVPDSEYSGTLFSVILGASLNDCGSHKEWLDAAAAAVGGYRDLLDVVWGKACAAAKSNTTTGGSGGSGGRTRPVPLPKSCRESASPTSTTAA